ncbi:endo-1,4-beta-xylanase [Oceanicoccus sagamiensis]|uniref:Beta-xylanase n=1 Tax=Oceanicoccus sagamiensis TaxID=716816 RepID=A0A1X9NIL8_9GAMM|nr:endo-1,4-beta-xylanase [Oceanicoccus sagamiensis]ARN75685.1 hypothetical protein BST96_17170 [Oceanicoccus sagamiensis]
MREFSSVTPESSQKWDVIHPEAGRWQFADSDRVVDFAVSHQLAIRGHTLVWGRASVPDYIEQAADAKQLRDYMADHISTLVSRYQGKIERWDVVNEPLAIRGGDYADYIFNRLLGTDYIEQAFYLAHQADPAAKLYINEWYDENDEEKFQAYYHLVQQLLDKGVPLHGVGIQAHYNFHDPAPEKLQRQIQQFAALGVEVELTELDIAKFPWLDNRLQDQGIEYYQAAKACTAVAACSGITVWGFTDRYNWIKDWLNLPGFTPLLMDQTLQPKPAYYGVQQALLERQPTANPF